MSNSPVLVAPPPPGYVSAEAKTTYIVVVLVLGVIAVLLSFILPFVIMIPLQFSMMADSNTPRPSTPMTPSCGRAKCGWSAGPCPSLTLAPA